MLKTFNEKEIETGRTMAVVAHLFILGTLIAIFMNIEPKNRFSGFYIKQAFGLTLFFFALGSIASNFDTWLISGPFYFCFITLWAYSFIGAVSGEIKPLPKIGVYFQKWFDKLSA
ncbi:hypothetical protein LNQ81_16155 [Myroides sp. M-43]|uniref:hypothetical protein n=1 Tax=Myroides oncorhynchi TaxID=2893756 RepID=UPI001E5440E0|nr:hypothetical protein [Myroides oncorhynchi]MCC9044205.1 hypothetical protein [Myroides oncorhynchi]